MIDRIFMQCIQIGQICMVTKVYIELYSIYNISQQIQMLNQHRFSSVGRPQQRKPTRISQVYEEILKNFDREAEKIKFKVTNPTFDDALIIRPRKKLPKIQYQSERKGRMKFYSNKLVINEAVYVNQRRQCSPIDADQANIRKANLSSPPVKQTSVLYDRNKRILQLYKRVEKDAQLSPTRIRFTKALQNQNKQISQQLSKPSQEIPMKKSQNVTTSEKQMLDVLKEAKQKRKKLQLPHMKPQRSKSNIIISSYSTEPFINPQKKQKIKQKQVSAEKLKQKEQEKQQVTVQFKKQKDTMNFKRVQENFHVPDNNRVKTVKKIKYETKTQPKPPMKRKFNWKNQPLQLIKIQKQEFHRLIRYYLNIGQIFPIQSGFYKAYVGPGNNSTLIKKLLKDRGCWIIVDSLQQQPNFVWTQLKSSKFNLTLKKSDQKQFNQIIRKNQNLETNKQLQNFIKLKKNQFTNTCQRIFEPKHYLHLMNQIRIRFQSGNNINYFYKLKQTYVDFLQEFACKDKLEQYRACDIKLHNHMDNAGAIGDKKSLLSMMTKYCQIFDENLYNYIPETVHVENAEDFKLVGQKIPEGPWILKPGQATNRGTGITVHLSQQTLLNQISKKKKHKNGHKFTHIVQKYIDPLLYYGRKFDIRIWVLWNGKRLWWYKQGYLRTSSKQFTLKSLNKFIHLTNDAIQSQSDDFGRHQPANKLSFNQFQKYVESQYNFTGFHDKILQQMKEIAVKAFRMGNLVFDNENRLFNFELFGLDFLIDKKFKPWLIECNTNPCLQINCSLLSRLVPNMLQNLMNLTVDTYFPVPLKKKQNQTWNHDNFRFELLFNGSQDLQMKQRLMCKPVEILHRECTQEQQIYQDQIEIKQYHSQQKPRIKKPNKYQQLQIQIEQLKF